MKSIGSLAAKKEHHVGHCLRARPAVAPGECVGRFAVIPVNDEARAVGAGAPVVEVVEVGDQRRVAVARRQQEGGKCDVQRFFHPVLLSSVLCFFSRGSWL
jgi:hypothetical protein